jgi:hypothetical protein
VQYEIEDHQYISQTDGYHTLNKITRADTKFIVCSPDESLGLYSVTKSCKIKNGSSHL